MAPGSGFENWGKERRVGPCKPTLELESERNAARGRFGSTMLQLVSFVTVGLPSSARNDAGALGSGAQPRKSSTEDMLLEDSGLRHLASKSSTSMIGICPLTSIANPNTPRRL